MYPRRGRKMKETSSSVELYGLHASPISPEEHDRISQQAHQRHRIPAITAELGLGDRTVRSYFHRFVAQNTSAREDQPRPGHLTTNTPREVGTAINLAGVPSAVYQPILHQLCTD